MKGKCLSLKQIGELLGLLLTFFLHCNYSSTGRNEYETYNNVKNSNLACFVKHSFAFTSSNDLLKKTTDI